MNLVLEGVAFHNRRISTLSMEEISIWLTFQYLDNRNYLTVLAFAKGKGSNMWIKGIEISRTGPIFSGALIKPYFNSLGSSDTIWRWRSAQHWFR